jgi:hypothetical protein
MIHRNGLHKEGACRTDVAIRLRQAHENDRNSRLPQGAFDLRRRDGQPVTLLQDLIGCARQAIAANQKVSRATVGHMLGEQLGDGRAVGHRDVIGETSAIVIYPQYAH